MPLHLVLCFVFRWRCLTLVQWNAIFVIWCVYRTSTTVRHNFKPWTRELPVRKVALATCSDRLHSCSLARAIYVDGGNEDALWRRVHTSSLPATWQLCAVFALHRVRIPSTSLLVSCNEICGRHKYLHPPETLRTPAMFSCLFAGICNCLRNANDETTGSLSFLFLWGGGGLFKTEQQAH